MGIIFLLRADYDIDCTSHEYYAFMPFVVIVLVCFTFALPAVISFYLFRHRNDLYSTKTHQRIGWLCKLRTRMCWVVTGVNVDSGSIGSSCGDDGGGGCSLC